MRSLRVRESYRFDLRAIPQHERELAGIGQRRRSGRAPLTAAALLGGRLLHDDHLWLLLLRRGLLARLGICRQNIPAATEKIVSASSQQASSRGSFGKRQIPLRNRIDGGFDADILRGNGINAVDPQTVGRKKTDVPERIVEKAIRRAKRAPAAGSQGRGGRSAAEPRRTDIAGAEAEKRAPR